MSRVLEVDVCQHCGHVVFPPRPLCPSCGGQSWRTIPAARGIVEETTLRRHRVREEKRPLVGDWRETHLVSVASVRTQLGPVVVAWSPDDAAPGAEVLLEVSSGTPVARLPSSSSTDVATDGGVGKPA